MVGLESFPSTARMPVIVLNNTESVRAYTASHYIKTTFHPYYNRYMSPFMTLRLL